MKDLLLLFFSLCAGASGYLIATFWMAPILKYVDIRHEVTSDLVFYANVFHEAMLNDEMKERAEQRRVANRKHAAELVACSYRLPFWYRWALACVKENPLNAATALIGLSNSSNESYQQHESQLRRALNLKNEP